MRKITVLLAAVVALALAGVASAGIVDQDTSSVGDNDVASVTLISPAELSPTTAFAVGVWSSLEVAAPVAGSYDIDCAHAINDRSGNFVLTAGRFFSDATYLWIGSRDVAGPWFGWDVCQATVTLSQGGAVDHALVGWLASHNGN